MSEPIAFESATNRFKLPNLFPGQAQKEFFVNEAHAIIDCLLHLLVEAELTSPPASPAAGQSWLVGSGATGDWAGSDGFVALYTGSEWTFIEPAEGMRAYDAERQQSLIFTGAWIAPLDVPAPSGGDVIDVEARQAIEELISSLRSFGVFSSL